MTISLHAVSISLCILLSSAVVCLGQSAPASQAGTFRLWAIDDMVRIDPETGKAFEENPRQLPGGLTGDYQKRNTVWSAKDNTVSLVGARNEVVAFQVIIDGQGEGFRVETTPLAGQAGTIPLANIQAFRQWYIHLPEQKPMKGSYTPLAGGWYPDVCIPLSEAKYGNGFSIPSKDFHDPAGEKFPAQKNQAIWVDIHIPANAKPGTYTGKITAKNAAGDAKSIAVTLDVWDFAIPSEMNMIAHLINFGETIKEKDPAMMYAYHRMAMAHRTYISDDGAPSFTFDGREFDWKAFDERYGRLFDGSAFTEGPTAGQPLPTWPFPIEFAIARPDKGRKVAGRDWPLPATKTASQCGVVLTDEYKKGLIEVLKKVDAHFAEKGWNRTSLLVYQNCLDEAGYHKAGEQLEAAKEQAKAIRETASVLRQAGLKRFRYRIDIGSGFINNKLDLDGNGQAEGPMDVAKYFAATTDTWYIHGLCTDMPSIEVLQKAGGTVCFYNGFEPRVAPNALNGELLSFRQWAVAAWRCGLAGWVDWQFRLEKDFMGASASHRTRQVWYETQDSLQRNLYIYRGEQIGLPGKVFASTRLKTARRGAQDFEMLRLLTLKDGNDKRAQALAAKVTKATFVEVAANMRDDDARGEKEKTASGFGKGQHWSHNPAAWEQFRRELGEALAK